MSGPPGEGMADASQDWGDPGPAPSRLTTLVDVAHALIAHLASAVEDSCELAEVCLVVATADAAGAFGRPGAAHDALINALWDSLAKVAAKNTRAPAFQWPIPSLHDVQQECPGRVPQPSLLKRYLNCAGLPVPNTDRADVLLAATPTLAPPRLIKYVLNAHTTRKWRRGVVARRLAARGQAVPPPTLFPETKIKVEYVSGDVYRGHLGHLIDILEECAFFRGYTKWQIDLETHIAEATERLEPAGPRDRPPQPPPCDSSYYGWGGGPPEVWTDGDEDPVPPSLDDSPDPWLEPYLGPQAEEGLVRRSEMGNPTDIAAENVFRVYEGAMQAMVGEVVAAEGPDIEVAQLPELPPSLKTHLMALAQYRDPWRGSGPSHGGDPGGHARSKAAKRASLPLFRCSHGECDRKTKFSRSDFLEHWHKRHFGESQGFAKPTPARGAAVVRCGHQSCLGSGENVSFDGLRRHAEAAHCHVRGNAAY